MRYALFIKREPEIAGCITDVSLANTRRLIPYVLLVYERIPAVVRCKMHHLLGSKHEVAVISKAKVV